MFGQRAYYALTLLLIIGGAAAYTRDPDWHLPVDSKVALIASPSGEQAAAPRSGGATMASCMPGPSNVAPASGSTAKPNLAIDANSAVPGNQRPAFRRIAADSRDSTASVEASKPNPTSAAGLLDNSADVSGAKPANSGRGAVTAADPNVSTAPGSAKADAAPKPPAAQAGKEPVMAKVDADREVRKKVRKAKRRLPTKIVARRKPWERRASMVARSGGYGPYGYSACRLEMRWATTIIGYQPIWARVCN